MTSYEVEGQWVPPWWRAGPMISSCAATPARGSPHPSPVPGSQRSDLDSPQSLCIGKALALLSVTFLLQIMG